MEEAEHHGTYDSADGAIGATRERLSGMTDRLWLWGDLIGFAGIALIVLGSVLASASTTTTHIDGIMVPADWAKTLSGIPIEAQTTQILMPSLFTGEWLLIFGVGVIGVFRERWLLVVLSLVALMFPWPWFGFAMKLGPTSAGFLMLMAFIRLWRPGKVMLAVFVVAFLIGAPSAATLFSNSVAAFYMPQGYPTERYARLGDSENTAQGRSDLLASLQNVQTSSPDEAGLKAFALAQAQLLVGDAAAAQSSLHELSASAFAPDFFQEHRMNVIANFVASAGLDGPQAKADLQQRALTSRMLLWFVNGLGSLLIVVGLFLDVLGKRLFRRNVRIADFEQRLHLERARPGRAMGPEA